MRNQLSIIMDTEAEHSITIGKDTHISITSYEELSKVVLLDIATLCEALTVLIREAHKQGIRAESDSIKICIDHLEKGFIDPDLTTGTIIPTDFKKEDE